MVDLSKVLDSKIIRCQTMDCGCHLAYEAYCVIGMRNCIKLIRNKEEENEE